MQDLNDKVTGSTLLANEFNEIPSEIQNVIVATGQTLASGDLDQLGKGIAEYAANGSFYTDGGAADAYVLSVIGAKESPNAYVNGMEIRFKPTNTNTGASTANVNSLGVKSLLDRYGNALLVGQIPADQEIVFVYNGTDFILLRSDSDVSLRFESVVSLIAADLHPGQSANTVSYVGGWAATVTGPLGGANYSIVTKAEHDTIRGVGTVDEFGDHTLSNSNVALLSLDEGILATKYGVTSDGVTVYTANVQAALDTSGVTGQLVELPGGKIVTAALFIKGNGGLIGQGWRTGAIVNGTELFLVAGTDDSHINFLDLPSRYAQVRNLSMTGNSANQTGTSSGINLVRESGSGFTSGDSFILADLFIKDYLSEGVHLGGFCNDTTLFRVWANFNKGNGILSFAGDIKYVNCMSFSNELAAFHENGFGAQYANCKAFFCGENGDATGPNRRSGWWFRAGDRSCTLVGCSSQENYGDGYLLDGASGVNINGIADGNSITYAEGNVGPSTARDFDGVRFVGASNNIVNISCNQFQVDINPTFKTQRYGINIDATSVGNKVIATVQNHDITATTGEFLYDAFTAAASNNSVSVNGQTLTEPMVESTVAGVSTSTEANYGLTLMDGTTAFTKVTIPAGRVPKVGISKVFRAINVTNVCQIVVEDHADGTLDMNLTAVGDTLVLMSDGNKWITVGASGSARGIAFDTLDFTDESRTLNTSQKYEGRRAFNRTTGFTLTASGGGVNDTWLDSDSNVVHTPAP